MAPAFNPTDAEQTPDSMYILGLYDGLWNFDFESEIELTEDENADAVMERMRAAKNGDWSFADLHTDE